jgi:hypothetical protein
VLLHRARKRLRQLLDVPHEYPHAPASGSRPTSPRKEPS